MLKFQRNYEAIFDIGHLENGNIVYDRRITIAYPITLSLNISMGSAGSANEGKFQFYNLSPDIRRALWVDNYNVAGKIVHLILRAGFNSDMPIVFIGRVQSSISYKYSGSTEWITDMQAFEGGAVYKYGYINSTYIEGSNWLDILNDLISNDAQTQVGYISKDLQTLRGDKTFIGQTIDILSREFEGYDIFISKGKLNIIGNNEVIPANLPLLTDESGLLGSPKRSGMFVEVDMLFEPSLNVGQIVTLKSKLLPDLNQDYKLIQITHNGMISAVANGTLTSTLTLFSLAKAPVILEQALRSRYTGNASGTWIKPVKGVITSRFGYRVKPNALASSNHQGIDIGAAAGTPIVAPADGKVVMAKYWGTYGKVIELDHGIINGVRVTTRYGHMRSFNVQMNQVVYQGQTLGLVGTTGNVTGPHLHFETRENGVPVNPTKYIGNY